MKEARDRALCISELAVDADPQRVICCDRDLGHHGVHLGRKPVDDGDELVQWTDADALAADSDTQRDDLPIWYDVLPMGREVTVDLVGHPNLDDYVSTLAGVVLDDHKQPAALVLDDEGERIMIPWGNAAAIRWRKP